MEESIDKKKTHRVLNPLRVALSVFLVLGLIMLIGPGEVLKASRPAEPIWIVPATFFLVLSIALHSCSFVFLSGRKVSFCKIFRLSFYAWSFGMITPGRLGEFSIVHTLGKEGISRREVLAVSLFLRISNIVILLGIFFLLAGIFGLLSSWIGISVVLCTVVTGAFVFVGRRPIWKWTLSRIPGSWLGEWRYMESVLMERAAPLLMLFVQFLRVIALFAVSWCFFRFIGVPVSYPAIAIVNSVARIAGMLPISFNGLGVREGVQVDLFGRLFGLSAAEVFSAAVWTNVFLYGVVLIVLVFWLFRGEARR